MKTIAFLSLILCAPLHAKSFGAVGEVFPVAEMSFLSLIEERLNALSASGKLDTLNQQWLQTVAEHSDRPKPLALARTQFKKHHYYKPEIILDKDIRDITGRILYPKGTRVNALQNLPSYRPCWLFFNADDKAQLLWAEKHMSQCASPKLILTGGSVSEVEKALQSVIYFDQAGAISQKLKLTSVPALISRRGNRLRIEELVIKENGDAL